MFCFEIEVNGTQICRSGIGEYGVLSTIATWVRRDPARTDLVRGRDALDEELRLEIGGLSEEAHLYWPSRDLKRGDVITIRLVESDKADDPTRVQRIDRDAEARAEREYYEQLKKRFEQNE